MSLLGKKWVILNQENDLTIIAKLLKNRGIDSPEKADWFFNASLDRLHEPRLLKEMDKAVERIKKAINQQEKVMVFGDYDVDGITATAIVVDFLKKVGVEAHHKLPNREKDGYGLKDYFIREFKEMGIDLIVTVDCGTSNLKEVNLARELGIDVVITDHHSMPSELPKACAIVNPKQPDCEYPNKNICGSSIAYKLVSALARDLWPQEEAEKYLDFQLGVVALGVVGDCMALKGENRILVREGVKRLSNGVNAGVKALMEACNLPLHKMSSSMIGFQIGPRINAAGRIDDPDHAFQLIMGNLDKATVLNELNEKRRSITRELIEEAVEMIERKETVPNIIVVSSPDWPSGLLGLIANGISDQFCRPTIAMQERENECVGSMRSVNDFDITENIREVAGELFSAFGGHAMAGGFSLPKENLAKFLKRVEVLGGEKIKPDEFISTLKIDCEINADELNYETCYKMSRLEPFGSDNPEPTLLLRNVRIQDIRSVGKTEEHLQFPVRLGDKAVSAIAFRFGKHLDKIDPAKTHDIVCNLEINEWNGRKKLQLRVVDLKTTDS